MAVAGLVLGIVAVLCIFGAWTLFPAVLGIVCGVLALIFGVVGRKQAVQARQPVGMATAGLVLGIIATALNALFLISCASCWKGATDLTSQMARQAGKSKTVTIQGPPAAMGTPVAFSDSSWTVVSAKDRGKVIEANDANDAKATTQGRFVEVRFKVTNLTKTEDSILDLPVVLDSQGRELRPYAKSASLGGASMLAAPLPPSIEKEFVEIYEVPADATGLKFRARALEAFGATRLVDLKL